MKQFLFLLAALFLLSLSSESQEKQLPAPAHIEANQNIPKEVINTTREFRERLLADPYRPAYHFSFPEGDGRPGDPNGAFYANGQYHLMYLYNREGTGFSWGHVSSSDLLHWRHHPDAIMPGNGDEGCFSGGAFVDDDGSAILSYWMLWGNKGIGLAKSTDHNFNQWKKLENNPVIKSTEWGITDMKDAKGKEFHIGSADPSNIWKKDGKYYLLTGNLLVLRKYGSRGPGLPANMEDGPGLPPDSLNYQGDHLYLFSSDNLNQWEYLHEFYKSDRKWTDNTEDNMCPSFLPLPSGPEGGKPGGKHLLLFISHNKGAQYYVGNYANNLFYPGSHGRMTWNDNAYFAPEALVDDKGRQITWSWIFDDRPDSAIDYNGWTGTYGLARTLWSGEDGTLRMRPVKEYETLRMKESLLSDVNVNSGTEVKLEKPGNELMELEVTFRPNTAKQYGVKVNVSEDGREETVIYYDNSDKKLKVDTRKSGLGPGRKIIEEAPLELKNGEPLVLRIFIDKSIVEVFANDRQAIARRVYPTLGGKGISLFAKGGNLKVKTVKAWELSPSNPY
ncbi:glycoside hydrolase family 32 protein [Flavihumibacter profundi]|uniref:glycoside hydrolase family 32 protein n=1 Tax=Flavihumibacter profundi TaxID=2716883 RepID=UPI001CC61536|nr:glycoside hydrolase family 32 protein [Flavihumibacter profundi]MBZ5857411.1 glycoside hydrolase family 32 protein [Flavihumibacter profundi]